MVFRLRFLFLPFCVLLLFAPLANAGFVSVNVGLADPPGPGPPPFVFDLIPDEAGNALLRLEELFSEDEDGTLDLVVSGITDSDPVLTISKDVTNNTGSTWVGYDIGIDGGSNTFVAGSASSDTMTLSSESATLLEFRKPLPVLDGDTVNFTFDILIPTTGPFEFRLTQMALVPEPATFLLALLGAGLLLPIFRRTRP